MGCGCLVALFAMVSPRLAIAFMFVFTDRMGIAFDRFWIGFAGFVLLPWTTLAWSLTYARGRGVTGFGWMLVILGLVVDLSTHAQAAKARADRGRTRR